MESYKGIPQGGGKRALWPTLGATGRPHERPHCLKPAALSHVMMLPKGQETQSLWAHSAEAVLWQGTILKGVTGLGALEVTHHETSAGAPWLRLECSYILNLYNLRQAVQTQFPCP